MDRRYSDRRGTRRAPNFTRRCLLSVCLLVATLARTEEPASLRFPTVQISLEQWRTYLAEVRSVPDARCKDTSGNELVCESPAQRTIWIFTREGHAAHPAVSRAIMAATLTSRGWSFRIDRTGHYAGDRKAFDDWIKALEAQDAHWRSAQQPD